jgi:hypothetical protein
VVSVFSNNSLNGKVLILIGLWVVIVIGLPIPNGNLPYLKTFQELLIVKGTTYPSLLYFVIIFNPFEANDFDLPFLLLVPSGKMTADHLFLLMFFAKSTKVTIACFQSFLSIKAAPPLRRL